MRCVSRVTGPLAYLVGYCVGRWYPDAAEKLASAAGGLAEGTAADGCMGAWWAVCSSAPVTIEDHRDAEKRRAYAEAMRDRVFIS